ncbi:MAG TPA: TIM barrel protein, partial [Opitutaceae bacterium]|nr:TIM barrel protein [Opitutaceae bacterium]
MPKFAANLTMLFNEAAFLDRFDVAAKAGFKAVEFLFPYAFDQAELQEKLGRNGLKLALFNLPAGDWAAGDRGIACLPDRMEEFRAGLAEAVKYARALDCPRLNCLAGIAPQGADPKALHDTLVENVCFAANALSKEGLRLLIEPINTRDVPGFYLNGTQQALNLIRETGSD